MLRSYKFPLEQVLVGHAKSTSDQFTCRICLSNKTNMDSYPAYGPPYNSYDQYGSYGASRYPPDSAVSGYGGPTSSPSPSSSKRRGEYTTYFLPGYGISRPIIFNHYQLLLGPSATIKPFSYQKREGYMITNVGSALTRVSQSSA